MTPPHHPQLPLCDVAPVLIEHEVARALTQVQRDARIGLGGYEGRQLVAIVRTMDFEHLVGGTRLVIDVVEVKF